MTGSLDKSFEGTPKIVKPEKPVIAEVTVNGTAYHKSCFKCTHGGCVISPSNYIAHEGRLYCKHHHIQLIKEKGNYSQLETDQEKMGSEAPASAGEQVS
ncbi:putative LIM domain-containing protein WLIM1 [Cocos nucifera]|uniref:Putative LIM domain-containing protein WLIM1 n=1 Tax=Cocos nucifera TaxID=13894 RepID=A0A8K0I7W3_COCNU|nr:putative LIM domain-containing protein WLIM1 [Cocos nucifera]